jgi:hypothetical protein
MTPQKLALNFLNEMETGDTKDSLSLLNRILEHLEEKADPEPIEMEMVDLTYQLLEKFQLLEAAMKKYIADSNSSNLEGNILSDLYERQTNPFDD